MSPDALEAADAFDETTTIEQEIEIPEISLGGFGSIGSGPLTVHVEVAHLMSREANPLDVDQIVDLVTKLHAIFEPDSE